VSGGCLNLIVAQAALKRHRNSWIDRCGTIMMRAVSSFHHLCLLLLKLKQHRNPSVIRISL
jgi:hypothetical protein